MHVRQVWWLTALYCFTSHEDNKYTTQIYMYAVIPLGSIMYVHVTQLHAFINVLKLNITARF